MAEEFSEAQPAVSETADGAIETDRVELQSSAAKSIDAETVAMYSSAAHCSRNSGPATAKCSP